MDGESSTAPNTRDLSIMSRFKKTFLYYSTSLREGLRYIKATVMGQVQFLYLLNTFRCVGLQFTANIWLHSSQQCCHCIRDYGDEPRYFNRHHNHQSLSIFLWFWHYSFKGFQPKIYGVSPLGQTHGPVPRVCPSSMSQIYVRLVNYCRVFYSFPIAPTLRLVSKW